MAMEIGDGGSALARIPNFRARQNVIDASQGGNYSGGSDYPDSGRIPLMPSSVGLAGLSGWKEEGLKYGKQAASGDITGAAKGACEAATRAGAAAATTAAGLGPIGGAIPTDLVCGPLVDFFSGADKERARVKRDKRKVEKAYQLFASMMNAKPTAFFKNREKFERRFHKLFAKTGIADIRKWNLIWKRAPLPGGTWVEKLKIAYLKNPQNKQKFLRAKAKVEAERTQAAEAKAANRARESARNVGMAIIVTAVDAFGDEFRKNPSLIGEGVMAYTTAMRNNPRLQKFDRAQVENLLRSKTNVQSAADAYFKKNPQDKARAFALAVDYKKKQAELVQLNRLIKAKQKKDKAERKQNKKRRRQKQEVVAVEKAAAQPHTKAAKKVAKSVGKKAKQLDAKSKRRAQVTRKARKEAQRLRKKVDRLKRKLAAQKTKPATPANKAQAQKLEKEVTKTQDVEQKMAATNVVGAALTRNTAVQAALARQIERAVQAGNTRAAQAYTKVYLRLGGVAEKLKHLQKLQLQEN